jgi:hypothetical protein
LPYRLTRLSIQGEEASVRRPEIDGVINDQGRSGDPVIIVPESPSNDPSARSMNKARDVHPRNKSIIIHHYAGIEQLFISEKLFDVLFCHTSLSSLPRLPAFTTPVC